MEQAETVYLIRLDYNDEHDQLFWCGTRQELNKVFENFPFLPDGSGLRLALTNRNIEDGVAAGEIIAYHDKSCKDIADRNERILINDPYTRDESLFDNELRNKNKRLKDYHTLIKKHNKNFPLTNEQREYLNNNEQLVTVLLEHGMSGEEIFNFVFEQGGIPIEYPPVFSPVAHLCCDELGADKEEIAYSQLVNFLNEQGQEDYNEKLLANLREFAELGVKFEDLLCINFNEDIPFRDLNCTLQFKKDYLEALEIAKKKYGGDEFTEAAITPFVHEVFYKKLSKKIKPPEYVIESFALGVFCEILAEKLCPSPNNKYFPLTAEHLQYRGDLVCLECRDVDIDVKFSYDPNVIEHCKDFNQNKRKAVRTRYLIYFEQVADHYCLRLKDCIYPDKCNDKILFNNGERNIWVEYMSPVDKKCYIISVHEFNALCNHLTILLTNLYDEPFIENVKIDNVKPPKSLYKPQPKDALPPGDEPMKNIILQQHLMNEDLSDAQLFMQREFERGPKIKALRQIKEAELLQVEDIKEKLRVDVPLEEAEDVLAKKYGLYDLIGEEKAIQEQEKSRRDDQRRKEERLQKEQDEKEEAQAVADAKKLFQINQERAARQLPPLSELPKPKQKGKKKKK